MNKTGYLTKEEQDAFEKAIESLRVPLDTIQMRGLTKEEAQCHDRAISELFKFDSDITKETLIDFLDSIRDYEHESGHSIYDDERTSDEIVDIFLNNLKSN
jgi:hypothetical protein